MLILPFVSFGVAFAVSALLIPVIRNLAIRWGLVAKPKEDRWHKKVTPVFGGVAMYLGFIVAVLVLNDWNEIPWGLVAGSSIMFFIGIYDDLKPLTPPVKMVGQIMAAVLVVFSGYRTAFFSQELLNMLVTVVWLVGITNALNFLDNMDGLAGGIAFISAAFLSFFLFDSAQIAPFGLVALALAGSILGFLVYNFPPASIFMGDSGSLFLGFTLAAMAIARTPQASNVFAVLSGPTLLFLLPILDTTLVTITRILRGQSPTQGGRDHTSHRLVAFGLSERGAVLVLYAVAVISGIAGAVIEAIDYHLGLLLLPALAIAFALLAAYLGRLKVVTVQNAPRGAITNLMLDLTYKRRLFEITLDFFLITLALYAALWIQSGLDLTSAQIEDYLQAAPVVVGISYLAFFLFGVYRGVWRYMGLEDVASFGRAAVAGGLLSGLVIITWWQLPGFSFASLFLFVIFLFLGWFASRTSFKYLDQLYIRQTAEKLQSAHILIYGAGDFGEIALRWIMNNPRMGYHVAGFVDDDPYKYRRSIHGVQILGGLDALPDLIKEYNIQGVIMTDPISNLPEKVLRTTQICEENKIWVQRLRLTFETINSQD